MNPILWPEWAWKLYVAWAWLLSHRPVTHRKAFWDAYEDDLDWIAYHAAKALTALEEQGEQGWAAARGHLYDLLEILQAER